MSKNIKTLIGVLLDVSGSMKSSVGDDVNESGGEWARSIFRVIDDLIKHDVTGENEVFALAFGSRHGNGIFDILSTLKRLNKIQTITLDHEETIDRILNILENAGASSVKKWVTIKVIKKVVSHNMAKIMLCALESDLDFVQSVVEYCLPPACKGYQPIVGQMFGVHRNREHDTFTQHNSYREHNRSREHDRYREPDRYREYDPFRSLIDLMFSIPYNVGESVVSTVRPANEHDIETVLENAKGFLLKSFSTDSSIFQVKHASNIIHGCVDEEELTENRANELMDIVRPFIYGRAPLFESLLHSIELFSDTRYQNHKKLLFVLSDGMPTDKRRENVEAKLRNEDLHVISCFITRSTAVDPHKLYSQPHSQWGNDAIFMFNLSSKIKTELLPRTILIKRGWEIDIENNETNLFLQVNHPDHIKDACDLARNVVCCQDALAELLFSVSLDIYINQSITGFRAQRRSGSTCYANASSAVLHLSMKRIFGREGGYPDFTELRQELIDQCGVEGANTLAVLQNVCPKYRLHCHMVDIIGAMHAITAKRPVVARFHLTDAEWEVFSKFYRKNKTGVLTRNEIDLSKPRHGDLSCHAVVLTSFNSKCLYLMNSWGTEWGDNGFFRVENADVLKLEFIDVFWNENDLTENEKDYYKRHGSKIADKLMKSLIGLQKAEYQCPLCHQTSLVTEFSGHLTRAKCPKCRSYFDSNEAGNILALNMYLTSISR